MQEVLVVIVIGLAIFFLPRFLGKRPAAVRVVYRRPALTGWMRLAIVVTIFWLAGAAFVLKPWQDGPLPFLPVGLGPAAAIWGGLWIWQGYKRPRR